MKLTFVKEKKKKIIIILIFLISLFGALYLFRQTFASYQFTSTFKTIEGNVIVRDKIAAILLKNETNEQDVSEAKNMIAKKQEASQEYILFEEENGLFQTEDDYGTSYYYNGNVENNYVAFADFLWRIVRINGDGSIRLIYDGKENSENNKVIATDVFNSSIEQITYVGYSCLEDAYEANDAKKITQDSLIKNTLENWYQENLMQVENLLADEIFCNDRSLFTSETDTNFIVFQSYNRVNTSTPTLKCANKVDQYSVDPLKGNGLSKKPIGLLTIDEAIFAGMSKESSYLDSLQSYWTMTPNSFSEDSSQNFGIWIVGGEERFSYAKMTEKYGIRPVINIKADVTAIGDGTKSNPYILEEF